MKKEKICENSYYENNHYIGIPKCYNNKAQYTITVMYNEVEKDIIELCEKCFLNLKELNKKHGYKLLVSRI